MVSFLEEDTHTHKSFIYSLFFLEFYLLFVFFVLLVEERLLDAFVERLDVLFPFAPPFPLFPFELLLPPADFCVSSPMLFINLRISA